MLATGILESSRMKRIEEEETAEETRLEHQRLLALINSMADGVLATDQSGTITLYNASVLDILNVNTTLEGQKLNDIMKVVNKDRKKVDIISLAKKSRAYYVTRDLILKQPDNELVNLYISISPVRLGFGKSAEQGYIMVVRDIT